MSFHPPFMFPHHQKDPRTYTIPYKATRSSWYIQPYVPHSYKILVPLIKIGERLPLSTKEIIKFDNSLDSHGFVKLPRDIRLYLQQRGMQHEIQVWRERLTKLRTRLKRVDFPEAGGYIVLGINVEVPQDPQDLQGDPKPLAELLEDFFGPIQKDQLTPAILMFYQKRELDRRTRVFDDWETLFWPKLSPIKPPTEAKGGGPSGPVKGDVGKVGGNLETVNRDLGKVKADPTKDNRNLKVAVEDVPEISKPLEQFGASQALGPPGKGQVEKTDLENEGTPTLSAPLAAATTDPRGTGRLTVRPGDGIGFTIDIPVNFVDGPSTRGIPVTRGPALWGARRGTKSAPVTPASPIPRSQLVSGTKSAQVQRTLDRFSPGGPTPNIMFPPIRPTPVSGSLRRPLPSEKLSPTIGRAQGGGSIDGRSSGKAFGLTEYDNLTFVLPNAGIYPSLKNFERWVEDRIVPPFILIIVLYNSLLICWWVLQWRHGLYEAQIAEAQAPPRQGFSFDDPKRLERTNMRELDEDWLHLPSYEREREVELEWDKMVYMLEIFAGGVGETQDYLLERI